MPAARLNSTTKAPSEWERKRITVLESLHLCHSSPGAGERQYRSGLGALKVLVTSFELLAPPPFASSLAREKFSSLLSVILHANAAGRRGALHTNVGG